MDSLDLDNTVLNSIAFEDYDVLRKTDHSSRTPANSSKRILVFMRSRTNEKHYSMPTVSIDGTTQRKTRKNKLYTNESFQLLCSEKPSDIDSSALFEENNITASDFVLDPELSFKNKRSNESSPETQEKRKKIDDLCAMQLCGPKYKKIAVGPSETSKTSAKNNTFEEFDAFANYLNKVHQSEKEVPSKSINSEKGSPGLENEKTTTLFSTQFMSTQAINEIDPAMRSESTISSESHEETDEASKLPLLLSFRERLKSKESIKESSMDREIGDRSVLFENEKITTQYRQEVDNLFEQIEHSIYAMGVENANQEVPDRILDIIFSDDLSENQNENPENDLKINWPEDSVFNGSNFNLSFGTVIKKALINNATKVQPRKILDTTLNLTLSESKAEFHNLGPFYGLPSKVKDLVKLYKGIDELYDWQEECLKLPAIENKKNLIYALPTSGGKTLVAEIIMFREVLCYKRNALFILPYVSIVQEKVWALSPFGVALDFLVEEYASSKGVYPPRKRRRKNCIYIATIEKALGIVNSLIETGRLGELGVIVVDELHLVGEEGRGATLEATLSKIMFLKANAQIIGMSATIGNLPDVCEFLNADVYTKNFRPVELTEYVKIETEISKINWSYTNEDELLIEPKKINYKYSKSILKMDPDMIGGLVTDVVPKSSCLIFCPTKKNCENVASLLCKLCKPSLKNYKKLEKEQLKHALTDECGELCNILEVSVQYGIAYHHSGLTNDERRIIEEGFRAGIIYVICCTSTLAAGVNLPARRVILRSPYIGKEFINLSRYKQMVGRAGRAGLGS